MAEHAVRLRDLHPHDAGKAVAVAVGSRVHPPVLVRNVAGVRVEAGASWKILAPDGRIADSGEVLEIEPPASWSRLSWQNHLFPDTEAEGPSRSPTRLKPQQGDSVKLTLTHEMDQRRAKLIGMPSRNGWPAILASLKSLLETGEPLELTRHWPEGV